MVTKDKLELIVAGKNETGRVFKDVSDEISKLRAEASRPLQIPGVAGSGDRDRIAGMTRGLRRAGDAAEERIRRDRVTMPGRELSAGDLRREQGASLGTGTARALGVINASADEFGRALKTALIAGVILKTAQAIGNIPKAMDDFRAAVKSGEDKFAALGKSVFDAIPIVSQFAEAGRALRIALDELRNPIEAAKTRAKEGAQDSRDERVALRDKTNARRAGLAADSSSAVSAAERAGVTDPLSLAQIARDDQLAAAKRIRQNAGAFGTTKEQDAEKEKARRIEVAAERNYQVALTKVQNDGLKERADAEKVAEEKRQEAREDARQKAIAAAGKAWDDRVRDLVRDFNDMVEGLGKPVEAVRPSGPAPFSGESKLLTGVGSTTDPLLQPTKSIDKNMQAVAKAVTDTARDIAKIVAGGGTTFIIGVAP